MDTHNNLNYFYPPGRKSQSDDRVLKERVHVGLGMVGREGVCSGEGEFVGRVVGLCIYPRN